MDSIRLLIEAKPFCLYNNFPMEKLIQKGFIIDNMRGATISNSAMRKTLETSHVLICGNDLEINESLLALATNLKLIVKIGSGLDTIDIPAVTKSNIVLCDTRGANKQAVADHTFALLLSVARNVTEYDREIRQNKWNHAKSISLDIWGKTIGIIGLGAIGQCVALRAKGFNMKIVAYDIIWPKKFALENEIEKLDFEEVLKISDFISLHVPLLPETKNLINSQCFKIMKPHTIIINTARGGIINEKDLFHALKNKSIAGAGIDVFEHEPPLHLPLADFKNIVFSPHVSAFTKNSLYEMDSQAVDQVIEFFQGHLPKHTVNEQVLHQAH